MVDGRPAPLHRVGLVDQLIGKLLDDILGGVYPPGSRLPAEGVLAEHAGVSRLTVREAVRGLRQRGVVRVEQGRGTFVAPLSQWSVLDPALLVARAGTGEGRALSRHLTEVRRVVETGAAELAAVRRTDDDLARMDAALGAMRAELAGDAERFSAADIAFHDAVLAAAGNPFIAALLAPVQAGLRRVRVLTSADRAMCELAIRRHTAIRTAIGRRARHRAAEEMSRHLVETETHIDQLV